MLKSSRLFVLFLLAFMALTLSACARGGVSTGWPGITVDDQTAYLANGQFVYAINLANGSEIWKFPAEGSIKATFFAPPAVTSAGQVIVGGFHNTLYSLDASGQEQWSFKEAKGHFIAQPLVTDTAIYAPNADGKLYAFSLSGEKLWEFNAPPALWSSPLMVDGLLLQPAMNHFLYAIDPQNGQEVWKSESLGGALVGTSTLDEDGRLYLGTFGREMLALDASNGQVLNRYTTEGWVWDGPALDDGKLYFGDLNGFCYALNAADLSEIWKVQCETAAAHTIPARPVVTEEGVYFTTEAGNLILLDATNGAQRWSKPFEGKLHARAKQAGELLLLAPMNSDQLLIAVGADGNQQWAFQPAE